jgi:hypothetical protein
MAWTTITAPVGEIDDEIATFESGVTSIDGFSVSVYGMSKATALIEYTA